MEKPDSNNCLFFIAPSHDTTIPGSGMAKIKALYIIPAFFIGKFTSDTIAVHLGKYAAEHVKNIIEEALSWKSITSLVVGLLLLGALLFVDWRSLIQKRKFQLKFKIWK